VTGNVLHLGEAAALFAVAIFMGGVGGAAHHMVFHSRMTSSWKPYITVLAVMEAYLVAGSVAILAIAQIAPALDQGLPATDPQFHVALHGYGICVVSGAIAITWVIQKTLPKDRPPTPPVR
jgi:DMSO reductase anchor subunit